MTKKTRLILLLVCVALFFSLTPFIVLYSMGYRFDFSSMKITATGGIYVRSLPEAENIIIDSKINQKPAFFSRDVFVQNLLPKQHSVLVQKTGYYSYQKNISVKENQVTKLEDILLIKNNLAFDVLSKTADYFSFAPDLRNILIENTDKNGLNFNYYPIINPNNKKTFLLALSNAKVGAIKWAGDSTKALIEIQNPTGAFYYIFDPEKETQQATPLSYLNNNSRQISFNPQNSSDIFYIKNNWLYRSGISSGVLKNVIAYLIENNNIIWLSSDGFIYESDVSGKLINKLTTEKAEVAYDKNCEIISASGKILLKDNGDLFALDTASKTLKKINSPAGDFKLLPSPDAKNFLYTTQKEIYIYLVGSIAPENKKVLLASQPNDINYSFWLNNSYIIFSAGGRIIISEIDYRGNINTIPVPQKITMSDSQILEIKNPEIFFNRADGKLYILTGNTLLSSEKITQ